MKNGIKTLAVWLILGIIFIGLLNAAFNDPETKMSYSELVGKISSGEVSEIEIASDKTTAHVTLKGTESTSKTSQKEVTIPSLDAFMEQISNNIVSGQLTLTQEEESIIMTILSAFSPFIILIVFLIFWLLLMNPNQNNNKSMSFGKSKARMLNSNDEKTKVTFKDVAGIDEEKEELAEIVEFLKSPKKFTDMGAIIAIVVLLLCHK